MPRSSIAENFLSCLPFGALADEGIALLVKIGEYRILLDCGLKDFASLNKNISVDLVLCSHAHQQHASGLLELHKIHPNLPVYCSQVTSGLLPFLWPNLKEERLESFWQVLPWRSPVNILPNLTVELFPSGHIPGAAAFLLTYRALNRSYKIFYTGDFSLSNFQLVDGLSLNDLRGISPDVLIIDAAYGTNRHPHRRQQERTLMERINQSLSLNQNILFLVGPVGLGQEILKLLRSHHQFTGRNLDIWVAGEVATVCSLYMELLSQMPTSVQNFAKHQPLFWDERIYPRMFCLSQDNQPKPNSSPYILLTNDPRTINSHCLRAERNWMIMIPEISKILFKQIEQEIEPYPTLSIESYLLAEHSDGRNTTQLIHNLRPQHVLFINGTANYMRDLASLEELQNRYQLHVPTLNKLVDFPIGEKFIQPSDPLINLFEGELNEVESSVLISLPTQITEDTRWSSFADTGIIEARWQGDELVIRGLQEREMLIGNNENKTMEDFDCCYNCQYYRGFKCWNRNSPLFDFKVTPDGCCPLFQA